MFCFCLFFFYTFYTYKRKKHLCLFACPHGVSWCPDAVLVVVCGSGASGGAGVANSATVADGVEEATVAGVTGVAAG